MIHKPGDKDKNFSVLGFGAGLTVMSVHDGSTDSFSSMPPMVRKHFVDTSALRTFMGASASSKVFALIFETFEKKGVHEYELSNVKHRSGYGKCDCKPIPVVGLKQGDVNRFFGTTTGSATTDVNAKAAKAEVELASTGEGAGACASGSGSVSIDQDHKHPSGPSDTSCTDEIGIDNSGNAESCHYIGNNFCEIYSCMNLISHPSKRTIENSSV